nr:immunoglobulin light chain junction region [Macaca mulatta]MOV67139.1 immunoglobulin light chain junction region [Macaca mulatta]MOV67449.1 immunoglobulin light chain junction region [Macaca mulatta]MOV68537.1 immunoglobulin light chain junction region [Macaca mulatta]MOV71282.1 immunoglobulin light chain junction region [Macaca mulatta]
DYYCQSAENSAKYYIF